MSDFVKLTDIKPNPKNPRVLRDVKFISLLHNILRYSVILQHRPMVVRDGTVYGGNMRYRVFEHILRMPEHEFNELCHSLMLDIEAIELWQDIRSRKAIPASWVGNADHYTEADIKAFTIIDNVSYGEHDWDMLANEWKEDDLNAWGLIKEEFADKESKSRQKSEEEFFDDPGIIDENKFGVIVYCDDETHQEETYNKLRELGYECKIVVV